MCSACWETVTGRGKNLAFEGFFFISGCFSVTIFVFSQVSFFGFLATQIFAVYTTNPVCIANSLSLSLSLFNLGLQ